MKLKTLPLILNRSRKISLLTLFIIPFIGIGQVKVFKSGNVSVGTILPPPAGTILMVKGCALFTDTNGFENMKIDSAGDVGIGISNPSQKLAVVTGNGTAFA